MSRQALLALLFLSCSMAVGCKSGSATAPQATASQSTDRTETRRTAGDEIALSACPADRGRNRHASRCIERGTPEAPRYWPYRARRRPHRSRGRAHRWLGHGRLCWPGRLRQKGPTSGPLSCRRSARHPRTISDCGCRIESGASLRPALAQRIYERAQTLLRLKAGSVQQVEQARQDVLSAETAVKAAQIEIDRTLDVLEDDLRVPADPTPGDETADQVPIFAPVDGYVIQKNVTVCKTIQRSTETFVIGDLSQVWMLVPVCQENLSQLRIGQPATVTLPGEPSRTFAGSITNLGQQFYLCDRDSCRCVSSCRMPIIGCGPRCWPVPRSRWANASRFCLFLPARSNRLTPRASIFVRRRPANRFAVRPVQTGETAGGQTPIIEGLHAGEQVVVQGSFVLKSHLLKSTMESE